MRWRAFADFRLVAVKRKMVSALLF